MMQGITGLPGAQPPQGPQGMPQGAPPGAMPQPPQQPQTPMGMTGQLEKLPPQQLLAMFSNPTDRTPKWAVVSAYAKAIENQRMMDAARNQSAMQQAQAQGNMPVAAQVMSQPLGPSEPVMARDGGIMSGYAGGGAVAFQSGGSARSAFDDVGILPISEDKYPGETREEYLRRKEAEANAAREMNMPALERLLRRYSPESRLRRALYPDAGGEAAEPSAASAAQRAGAYAGKSGIADIDVGPSMAPRAGAAAPAARPPAAPVGAPSGTGGGSAGLDALIRSFQQRATQEEDPRITKLRQQSEAAAREQEAQLRGFQTPSPEELAARKKYYETVQGAYDPQRKSLEAARASQREGLLNNPEALAMIAGSLGGAKTLGEGLSKAAGAAGSVLGERRKRAEKLEDAYQQLNSQLTMTLAAAQRADAEGDEKRKRELLIQAQGIKEKQISTQMEMLKIGADLRGKDISGLASLVGARAQERAAGKPTAQESLINFFRSDPKSFGAFIEAQQGPKTEGSLLKSLIDTALKNPLMLNQYPPEVQALIKQELLKLGVTSAVPSGANVRE